MRCFPATEGTDGMRCNAFLNFLKYLEGLMVCDASPPQKGLMVCDMNIQRG